MIKLRSYGKCKLGSKLAINMVELLEFCITYYGVSIFAFDLLFAKLETFEYSGRSEDLTCKTLFDTTHCVNKTSIICIVAGCLNAFLPMDQLNKAIFSSREEKIDYCNYSKYDDDLHFLSVRIIFVISY